MAFELYCLVSEESSDLSINVLGKQLGAYFSTAEGFRQIYEEHPFDSSRINLLLSWGKWWIRVFYEFGEHVQQDSTEIAKHAEQGRASLISAIDRRLRVRFADDEDLSHTNHIIFMTDFLEARSDLIIFDPQRNVLVN